VPVRDTAVSEEMMVLACQLATERKSSIDALYVIEVPLNLPIDASLPEERERARQVLERAAQAADMFNVELTPVVVTARSAGKAIVETAIERRSEVIVLGSQGKRRIGDRVFGRTIDHVLNNLPCEAIINVIPKTPAPQSGVATAAGAAAATAPPAVPAQPALSKAAQHRAGAESAGQTGVKRRAQGLRLGRYLPQQRPGGEAPPDDGRGGEAAKGVGTLPPDKAP
jgi:nucleotide-binding universal stress UspA family protein